MSNNIKFYRERADLTLEAATKAAGWPSKSSWKDYEAGRRTPNIQRIKTLCKVLSGGKNGKITFEKLYGNDIMSIAKRNIENYSTALESLKDR